MRRYPIDAQDILTDHDRHYDTARRFGCFSEDGGAYTVTAPEFE